MTFVAGIKCGSLGIVLCTDSFEVDGNDKQIVKKLFHYDRPKKWGVAWGCAGDKDIISKFSDRLQYVLQNEEDDSSQLRLQELIEKLANALKDEYADYQLSLVAGIWSKNSLEVRLCKMQNRCLSIEDKYACVGMDLSLARFALDSVYNDRLTVGAGMVAAVFATHLMKERADGVGGPIQMCSYMIPKERWTVYDQDYTASMEKKFQVEDMAKMFYEYWKHRVVRWLPPAKD